MFDDKNLKFYNKIIPNIIIFKSTYCNIKYDIIDILSFNIFSGNCKLFINFLKKCNKFPDIICIQESPNISTYNELYKLLSKKDFTYNIKVIKSYTKHENIALLVKSNKYDNIKFDKIYKTYDEKLVNTERLGFIYNHKGIKIANLHLEGGRYFDIKFASCLKDENNTEDYINYKVKLLNDIIHDEPDIIVGDFNSVYHNDIQLLNTYLEKQYKYFLSLMKISSLSSKQKHDIIKLNILPFEILMKHNYELVYSENDNLITNIRGNTKVDFIWRKKHLKTLEFITIGLNDELLNTNTNDYSKCISDHNPIYAKLEYIIPNKLTTFNKYLKYKQKYNNIKNLNNNSIIFI